MKRTILFIFIILAVIPAAESSGQVKRVAILEITAKNAPAAYAEIARDILEVNIHKSGAFKVLERNQMKLVLKEQGFSMSGCTDTSCAVQIGKMLSADMVVTGTLFRIKNFTISLKFVDVTKGEIMIADSETAAGEDDIEGAINLDFNSETFKKDLDKLDKNNTYFIYCRSGNRSGRAMTVMKELGFKEVYNLSVGINEWIEEGFPLVK